MEMAEGRNDVCSFSKVRVGLHCSGIWIWRQVLKEDQRKASCGNQVLKGSKKRPGQFGSDIGCDILSNGGKTAHLDAASDPVR